MVATVVSLVASLVLALPLQTAGLDEVGAELRQDPVYVDPGAERAMTDADADQLRAAIRDAGTPIFVAVLPEDAATTPESAITTLYEATGLAGTYAVVLGDSFRAGSTETGAAAGIAGSAFQEHRDAGTLAVLEAFVAGVSDAATAGSGGGGAASDGDRGGDGGGSILPLVLLGGGGVALWAMSRRRRRAGARVDQAEFDADVQMIRAELSVLAEDVLRLEPEVVTRPEARQDYEAATTRYRAAAAALDYADEPVDLVRVERVVREAEYAMSRARAIVDGREPPLPPSTLQQPGRHDEPALHVDPDGRPVYVGASPMSFYSGGGWFGGGGGLFSGLLLGSMLGGGGLFGWGGHGHMGGWGGDGGGGGGDWGGGFGGGDWGGGDIGGGDW